jgi:hypothetical protein
MIKTILETAIEKAAEIVILDFGSTDFEMKIAEAFKKLAVLKVIVDF